MASQRFDQFFWRVMGNGYVAAYDDKESGAPQIVIWRLVLNQPMVRQ
jgi:hypothetical protein